MAAVGDLDAVIAARPECVVYCAMGDTRPREATSDVRRLLEAGIDVVGSAPGSLQFPWGTMPDAVVSMSASTTRITVGRLIDGTGSAAQGDAGERQAILIERDRIAAVGPDASVPRPAHARELEQRGLTV